MTPFRPQALDHLVFFVADLERTRHFYEIFLGPPDHRTADSVMFAVGDTHIFFAQTELPRSGAGRDEPGFNHIAFRVSSIEELQRFAATLDEAHVQHSGIKVDEYGKREFLWLNDPDQLRIELYLRA